MAAAMRPGGPVSQSRGPAAALASQAAVVLAREMP